MSRLTPADIAHRKQVARDLLALDPDDPTGSAAQAETSEVTVAAIAELAAPRPPRLTLDLPDHVRPVPVPYDDAPDPEDPLPRADIVVIAWTVAEQNGLADVMTPGYARRDWYRYTRRFETHYRDLIRRGAPALNVERLGSWFPVRLGEGDDRPLVLCMKSELHLNQDGITTGDGTATLPVADLFRQIIEEVQPRLIITTGTSGATYLDHDLGDVVVTRAAKFRLSDEFANEPFNQAIYRSEWDIPTTYREDAEREMGQFKHRLREPAFAPPTKRFPFGAPVEIDRQPEPAMIFDGEVRTDAKPSLPAYHPILTTDFFEFGTSDNGLEHEGAAVEMGDAVLGLVADEIAAAGGTPPKWLVVRNLSDPQINADLTTGRPGPNMQTHWAVWYYEEFGYWTSVNGALASWAVAAGFADGP